MIAYNELLDREIEWTKEKIVAYFRDVEGIMPAERVQRFAEGKGDKVPLNLALSDEWGAHYNGFKISEICLDARKLIYSHLNVCWRFKLEIWLSIFPHYYQLGPSALGLEIEFPEDRPPMSSRGIVNDFKDVERLKVPDMRTGGQMPYHWEAYRIWKEKLSDLYPAYTTNIPGPFDFAAQLRGIEGMKIFTDMKRNPGLVKELCDFSADCIIEIAKIYKEYGLNILFLSGAAVGHLTADDFMEFEFPYVLKIREALKSEGMLVSLFLQKNLEIQEKIYEEGMTLLGRPVPMIFTGNYYNPNRGYFPSLEDVVKGHQMAEEKGYPHMVFFMGQWLQDSSPMVIRRTIKRVFDSVGPISIAPGAVLVGTPVENIDAYVEAMRSVNIN